MRQTIECERCEDYPESPGEEISKLIGFPRRAGMLCDGCADPLLVTQLVVAVGIWVEGRIPNIPNWEHTFIREASPGEIETYRKAETSAKELRNDGTV